MRMTVAARRRLEREILTGVSGGDSSAPLEPHAFDFFEGAALGFGDEADHHDDRSGRYLLCLIQILKYPLRGYVVQVEGKQVIINLGVKQGVVLGAPFEVLEEQKAIEYGGRLLQRAPKLIAQLEVVQLEIP